MLPLDHICAVFPELFGNALPSVRMVGAKASANNALTIVHYMVIFECSLQRSKIYAYIGSLYQLLVGNL